MPISGILSIITNLSKNYEMAANVVKKIKIFYSYAHEDKAFRDGIDRHLATLRRLGQIITWYDREILPGSGWAHEIDAHLESSSLSILTTAGAKR